MSFPLFSGTSPVASTSKLPHFTCLILNIHFINGGTTTVNMIFTIVRIVAVSKSLIFLIKKMAQLKYRKFKRASAASKSYKLRKRFDIQPQIMYGYPLLLNSAQPKVARAAIPVPIPRTYSSKNPVVMELLKIEYTVYGSKVTADSYDLTAMIGTAAVNANADDALNNAVSNPTSISVQRFTSAQSDGLRFVQDFSSNDGRGTLVATDKLFFMVQNNAGPLAGTDTVYCSFRIWYRFMAVGMSEFVGIVNQQQQGGALTVPTVI